MTLSLVRKVALDKISQKSDNNSLSFVEINYVGFWMCTVMEWTSSFEDNLRLIDGEFASSD